MDLASEIMEWACTHIVIFVLFLFFSFRAFLIIFRRRHRFPDFGGRVSAIQSAVEWNDTIKSDRYTVVFYYATWNPVCRRAAPSYGNLSTRFKYAKFVEVDVVEISDVARYASVGALPTIDIWKNGKNLAKVIGWDIAKVEKMLLNFEVSKKKE